MGCKSKLLGVVSVYNPFSQYFGKSGKRAKIIELIISKNANNGLISFKMALVTIQINAKRCF